MVKEATTRMPRPALNKDGTPRAKPGKKPRPADVRTDRLVLRVHQDLMEILTERARERGITRSAYVEQLLIGWVRLDPRNRKVDLIGKYDPAASTPAEMRQRSLVKFVERWRRFAEASLLLLGFEPPREWFEDEELPDPDPRAGRHPYSDDNPPDPPFRRRR